MKSKINIKLNLVDAERKRLRQHKVKIADIPGLSISELEEILQVPTERARELYALADFQRIPTVGIRFAEDLICIGYYSVHELAGKDGATLTDEYEKKKGYRIDSCVEDQFRLAVHFAQTNDTSKKWWDFTAERKSFREAHGYPADRPSVNWHEVLGKN